MGGSSGTEDGDALDSTFFVVSKGGKRPGPPGDVDGIIDESMGGGGRDGGTMDDSSLFFVSKGGKLGMAHFSGFGPSIFQLK